MASERQNMSDQDISIKAREHELYVQSLPEGPPVKPFPVYLRETPGEPLSPATKVVLSITGVIVVVLFFAAVWRVTHPRTVKPKTRVGRPTAKAALIIDPHAPVVVSPSFPFTRWSKVMVSTSSTWPRDAFPLPVSYCLGIHTELRR